MIIKSVLGENYIIPFLNVKGIDLDIETHEFMIYSSCEPNPIITDQKTAIEVAEAIVNFWSETLKRIQAEPAKDGCPKKKHEGI